MAETMELAGARCLVTGATGALGQAVARVLRSKGADLVLTGRSETALSELANSLCRQDGGNVDIMPLDLAVPGSIAMLVDSLGGRLDVLVNNAAVQGPIGPFAVADWDAWEAALRFDLLMPIELTRAVLGLLAVRVASRGRRAKVVVLSGGGASQARPNFSAYAVAKTGLVRFAECLAREVDESGIDVNAVAPGAMPSAMTRSILTAGQASAVGNEHATAERALGATGLVTLSRAADLVAYLVSPASDGVTGRLISAVWDPWPVCAAHRDALATSDIYTLRRIVPADRGQDWG